MRWSIWLLGAAGLAGCAARGPAPEWVLIRSAAGTESAAPIYAWQEVRRFPNAEDCAKYDSALLDHATSGGSRDKLEDVYRQHCVPAAMMAPPK